MSDSVQNKNLEEELVQTQGQVVVEDSNRDSEPNLETDSEIEWDDPDIETVTTLFTTEELIVLFEGALVAGLGLFLLCSPTSGLMTQVIGSLVFLSGIVIVTM